MRGHLLALALPPLALAQDCAQATYAWCHGQQPFYFSDASLPPAGTSSCCGSQLVSDPSIGYTGRSCLCDVTANACDEGCCCDLDCSTDSLRYDGIFGCTSNGTAVVQTGYTLCTDSSLPTEQSSSANVEPGLVTAMGGADGLLCVIRARDGINPSNSPSLGAYLRDPVLNAPLTAQQVLAELDSAKPIQYGTAWLALPSAEAFPPVTYALDAPVLGDGCIAGQESAAGCARLAPVLLPAADPSGSCTSRQSLPYLRDIAPYACPLAPPGVASTAASRLARLASLCSTRLNASSLDRATFSSAPTISAPKAILTLLVRDTNSSSSDSYVTAAAAPSSTFDAARGVCSSALTGVQMQLVMSGAGTLTSVAMYATVGLLTANDMPTAKTTYGAAFAYASALAADAPVVRPTSGRPGYMRGLPLLVAEASALRLNGLKMLPRSPLGACGAGHAGATPVLFGEDLAVSCVERLTPEELEAKCNAGLALTAQTPFAALNLTNGVSKLGVYGDSHPNIAADWVPLTFRFPQNDAASLLTSWNPSTSECSNVLTGIHLRVLHTSVGHAALPVSKIVGGEIVFTSRTIVASRSPLGVAATTSIAVTATATFAELDSSAFEFVPDAPQLIPPLPHDFFYPFTRSYDQ